MMDAFQGRVVAVVAFTAAAVLIFMYGQLLMAVVPIIVGCVALATTKNE